MMDCLVVSKVKSAFKRMLFQLGDVDKSGEGFHFVRRGLLADIQLVDEHSGAGVAAILNRVNTERHNITPSQRPWKDVSDSLPA